MELAYRYWHLRLRSERGDASPEIEALQQARDAARHEEAVPTEAIHRVSEQEPVPDYAPTDGAPPPASAGASTPAATEKRTKPTSSSFVGSVARAARSVSVWLGRQSVGGGRIAWRVLVVLPGTGLWAGTRFVSRLLAGGWRRLGAKLVASESAGRADEERQAPTAAEVEAEAVSDSEEDNSEVASKLEERMASLAGKEPLARGQAARGDAGGVLAHLLPETADLAAVAVTTVKLMRGARGVIELPSGAIEETDTRPGDQLQMQSHMAS